MNHEKAGFFDTQVDAQWADTPYGRAEKPKLDRLFLNCGSLKGLTVLEPGCGTGRLTQKLALAVGPTGCVNACDISPKMVRKARQCNHGIAQARVSHAAMEDLDIEEEDARCHRFSD